MENSTEFNFSANITDCNWIKTQKIYITHDSTIPVRVSKNGWEWSIALKSELDRFPWKWFTEKRMKARVRCGGSLIATRKRGFQCSITLFRVSSKSTQKPSEKEISPTASHGFRRMKINFECTLFLDNDLRNRISFSHFVVNCAEATLRGGGWL